MFSSQYYDMLSCTPPPAAAAVAYRRWKPRVELAPNCPRCDSSNTKFCYYNNYSLSQPRYFCKGCRRYWTRGGSLRNVPVGGGCRKIRRGKSARLSTAATDPPAVAGRDVSLSRRTAPPAAAGAPPILPDLMLNDMARSPCMTQAAEEAAAIDLAVLYAKYLNQCPQVESSFAMPALPVTEEVDHESIASVNGTPTQSSSCSQIPAQLPNQQAFLECQSPSQPTGEAQFSAEDYNILSMDLSSSLTLPMEAEAIDNCKSLDCPIGSNLLYQEFESGPVGMNQYHHHHQQNLVSDIDWSSLDYSSLEALYRC